MIKSISPLALAFLALGLAAQSQKELLLTLPNAKSIEVKIPNAQLDTLYWEKPYPLDHNQDHCTMFAVNTG